jgi:hypothetical protein
MNTLFCGFSGTPVGSRVTCSPAPTDTDRDWLVLVPAKDWEPFADGMVAAGWAIGGSTIPNGVNELPEEARFNSFVKGEDNVIATCSDVFHKRFLAATCVATRLNLLDKPDRIALFQAVLYGNYAGPTP